jgi:hypothetical protein
VPGVPIVLTPFLGMSQEGQEGLIGSQENVV